MCIRDRSQSDCDYAAVQFYKLYEELYGKRNCTYSVHLIGSHLPKIRDNVPLTEKSAFLFENSFSELRNQFQPGTPNPLKQILQNVLLKRKLEYHCCEKPIYYSEKPRSRHGQEPKETRENNYMIYVYDEKKYVFYNIIEKHKDYCICETQGKFKFTDGLTSFDWSSVGVFKQGPTNKTRHRVEISSICGKVLKVQNLLITCPLNVLREK